MGAGDSVTNKYDAGFNTRVWASGKPPTNTLSVVLPAAPKPYKTYWPECHRCSGTDGCGAGNCSSFTSWESCKDGGAAPLVDHSGNNYIPEGNDYQDGVDSCTFTCPSRPRCTRVNIEQCWLGTSSYDEPTFQAHWTPDNKIKCVYDYERLNKISVLKNYREKFQPDGNNDAWNRIMSNFCKKKITKCLIDPTTGKKIESCTLVTGSDDKDDEINYCASWFHSTNNNTRDAFIASVCSENPNLAECKCEMRANLAEYKAINQYLNKAVDDACVWIPCKGGSPAFLVNSRDSNPKCPDSICEVVYNVDSGLNTAIYNNQVYLSCPQKTETNPNPTPTVVEPFPKPEFPTHTTDEKIKERNKKIGYISIGVAVFLCLIILIILVIKK